MTTQDENQEFSRTEVFDPFPKPQTIPSGWDVSELLSDTKSAPAPELDSKADEGTR
jgi:hypothetical protein